MREFKYNVVQLINCVRDRPCLWDKTIENYKDRVERRSAWEEIFTTLDDTYEEMTPEEKRITGEQILNKWTNIRDTFMKTLKTKLGRPKKKYLLYDHLKFLTTINPEEESIIEYNQEESEVCMKQEMDTDTSSIVNNIPSTKKRSKRTDFDDKSTDYSVSELSYGSNKKKPKRFIFPDDNESKESVFSKKKSKKNSDKNLEETNEFPNNEHLNAIDFVEVDGNDPRIMNEDEAFFASLLPTIVKYNEDERLEFRIEVLRVMKSIKDKRKWAGE